MTTQPDGQMGIAAAFALVRTPGANKRTQSEPDVQDLVTPKPPPSNKKKEAARARKSELQRRKRGYRQASERSPIAHPRSPIAFQSCFHRAERRSSQKVAALMTLHMQGKELVRLERPSDRAIRKAKGWRLAAGNLKWMVLSLQAASIGQIPVFLCCLGSLLTPLLVTCDAPGRLAAFPGLAALVS